MKSEITFINEKVKLVIKKLIPEEVILSEKSFAKLWFNKKEDKAWKDL
jgi:hypothetical protein